MVEGLSISAPVDSPFAKRTPDAKKSLCTGCDYSTRRTHSGTFVRVLRTRCEKGNHADY